MAVVWTVRSVSIDQQNLAVTIVFTETVTPPGTAYDYTIVSDRGVADIAMLRDNILTKLRRAVKIARMQRQISAYVNNPTFLNNLETTLFP